MADAPAGGKGAPELPANRDLREEPDDSRSSSTSESDLDASVEPAPPMDPADAGRGDAGLADAVVDEPLSPADTMTAMDPELVGVWLGEIQDLIRRTATACISITQATEPGPGGDVHFNRGDDSACDGQITYESTEGIAGWFLFDPTMSTATRNGCVQSRLRLEVRRDGTLDYRAFLPGDREETIPAETGMLMRVDSCP